ncbi:MAG: hypothetical protein V3T05_10225 [Myxococcota bacterium]
MIADRQTVPLQGNSSSSRAMGFEDLDTTRISRRRHHAARRARIWLPQSVALQCLAEAEGSV